MRHTRSILALVVLAGCAASHEAPPESGSRLRAVWLVPSSGERVFWAWHDRERDVDCHFYRMTDGTLRCVPVDLWMYAEPSYADADCTAPVAVNAGCDARYAIERITEPDACAAAPLDEPTWRLWQLGEPRSASRVYRLDASGACIATDTRPQNVRPLALVDPSAFVAARLVPSTSTEAIVRDRYVADDGTTWPGPLRDRARDHECSLPLTVGELDRLPCVPKWYVFVTEPSAECDTRYAHAPPSACGPPDVDVVPQFRTNACGAPTSVEVYPVVREVPPGAGDPACYPVGHDALVLGPRADDLVPWFDVRRTEGRLQQPILEAAGGVRLPYALLHDAELGVDCTLIPYDDGVVRCAPFYAWRAAIHLYADPSCTEPAMVTEDCPESHYAYAQGDPDACGAPTFGTIYRAGDPIDVVYHRDPATGDCAEIPPDSSAPVYRAEVVPPDSLVALERVVE